MNRSTYPARAAAAVLGVLACVAVVTAAPTAAAAKSDAPPTINAYETCNVWVAGGCNTPSIPAAGGSVRITAQTANSLGCGYRVRDRTNNQVVNSGHVTFYLDKTIYGLYGSAYRLELHSCTAPAAGSIAS
jgi:hypothetical protein